MDTGSLVAGGTSGLQAIVNALEGQGINVAAAYLIRITAADGFQETDFRIVTEDDGHDVLYKYVKLRRDGALPDVSEEITLTPVGLNNAEATRVLDYARRIGKPPVSIQGVVWKGLYIEDAVVLKNRLSERETAEAV